MRFSLRLSASLRAWHRQSRCDAFRSIVLGKSAVLPPSFRSHKRTNALSVLPCSRLVFHSHRSWLPGSCVSWQHVGTGMVHWELGSKLYFRDVSHAMHLKKRHDASIEKDISIHRPDASAGPDHSG